MRLGGGYYTVDLQMLDRAIVYVEASHRLVPNDREAGIHGRYHPGRRSLHKSSE
jgi:hypothetical protein